MSVVKQYQTKQQIDAISKLNLNFMYILIFILFLILILFLIYNIDIFSIFFYTFGNLKCRFIRQKK